MKEITTINGAYSEEANGWVSDVLTLTGDAWLEVELPTKGRLVIKKAEPTDTSTDSPNSFIWPKALITPWDGPKFRIRLLLGTTNARHIKIITTETPKSIQYANI